LYQQALAIRENAFRADDPAVETALNNLAMLYLTQRRYADAEPLLKRSLAIREKALGPDHPNLAVLLNKLASLYDEQARYAAAEPLHKRALAIYEKIHSNAVQAFKRRSVIQCAPCDWPITEWWPEKPDWR